MKVCVGNIGYASVRFFKVCTLGVINRIKNVSRLRSIKLKLDTNNIRAHLTAPDYLQKFLNVEVIHTVCPSCDSFMLLTKSQIKVDKHNVFAIIEENVI